MPVNSADIEVIRNQIAIAMLDIIVQKEQTPINLKIRNVRQATIALKV